MEDSHLIYFRHAMPMFKLFFSFLCHSNKRLSVDGVVEVTSTACVFGIFLHYNLHDVKGRYFNLNGTYCSYFEVMQKKN
jgi:hypothetical protein